MSKDKTVYNLVINELIEYYTNIKIEEVDFEQLTDLEYEIQSGRKAMKESLYVPAESIYGKLEREIQYDNTRGFLKSKK